MEPIQDAIIKAAKAGNIKFMRELIKAGANPFLADENERNAISYALASNIDEAVALAAELFPVVTELPKERKDQ